MLLAAGIDADKQNIFNRHIAFERGGRNIAAASVILVVGDMRNNAEKVACESDI